MHILHIYIVLDKCFDFIQSNEGFCTIHYAASYGNVEVVIDLIEKHGVDPRCKGYVSY